ncbi:MAG: hypothetical protein N2045_13575 [Fimbriimonadales bacterium]|nr:hypothetical protein [Fimbriimonadales bacterium]
MDYPKTYAYLKQFEAVLRQRSGYKQILSKREKEFYGLMDINTYTFAPWKVVWREMASDMTAAVVGVWNGKPVVPDHKLMMVDCQSEAEAHYLCACLNSTVGRFVAKAYAVETQMNPHILEHIRIPRYNPADAVHGCLAALSQEAHACRGAGVVALEAQIDRLAAQVWGLTEQELGAMQRALDILNNRT